MANSIRKERMRTSTGLEAEVNFGGNSARVRVRMPEGSDPKEFTATLRQLDALEAWSNGTSSSYASELAESTDMALRTYHNTLNHLLHQNIPSSGRKPTRMELYERAQEAGILDRRTRYEIADMIEE